MLAQCTANLCRAPCACTCTCTCTTTTTTTPASTTAATATATTTTTPATTTAATATATAATTTTTTTSPNQVSVGRAGSRAYFFPSYQEDGFHHRAKECTLCFKFAEMLPVGEAETKRVWGLGFQVLGQTLLGHGSSRSGVAGVGD